MLGKALIGVVVIGLVVLLIVNPFGKDDSDDAGAPGTSPPEPVSATDDPSESPEATREGPMDTARCWQLIETTTPAAGAGTEEHAEAIGDALGELEPAEIAAFDRFLQTQLDRAYRWDLWAVAYIAMGGCGDDGFEYFRAWVIAHGEDYFERALKDPPRAADALEPGDEADGELLLYAAQQAYEAKTGGEQLPWDESAPRKHEPDGEPWDESKVHERYPDLAKRFGAG